MSTATEVKERPILFNGEMVQAILDGRKTQTRRVVKPQPPSSAPQKIKCDWLEPGPLTYGFWSEDDEWKCPYGAPGERLWLRETWRCTGGGDWHGIIYRADEDHRVPAPTCKQMGLDALGRLTVPDAHAKEWQRLVCKTVKSTHWHPSIHMPRWASRINLDVTGVRVERIQDISTSDILSEGMGYEGDEEPGWDSWGNVELRFQALWDSINDDPDRDWEANPYVWVIEFKTTK